VKRLFDICFSFIGLLLSFPLFLFISLFIVADSRGGVFFLQNRVGRHGKSFRLMKFRTMRPGADKKGELTIGSRDKRITRIGYFLRKYKLDELPQLLNVFIGDMSFVGPRPEVPFYVALYTEEQRKVLNVKPGLTDPASLYFFHENELLGKSSDPEKTYIEEIMPNKLEMSLKYVEQQSFTGDLKLIVSTIFRLFG